MNKRALRLLLALVFGVTAMMYVYEWVERLASPPPARPDATLTPIVRNVLSQALVSVRQDIAQTTNAARLSELRTKETDITNALARP